jgi:hypothetical protein
MPIPVTIKLTSVSGTLGPFSLYSCTGATCATDPFVTGVTLSSLQAGYGTSLVPDNTTSIKIKSTDGVCDYEITKPIVGLPTITPTPTNTLTPSPTPTVTVTVTATPTNTELPGRCYRYRIDPNSSPVNGNEGNYGISYTYPGSLSSDTPLSGLTAGLATVEDITYNTYSVCSSVEPTFLVMLTPTQGDPPNNIPSGVYRDGPLGGCSGNAECL